MKAQDKLAHAGPLTVVRAPQGFGKSAQVSAWLERLADTVVSRWLVAAPDDDGSGERVRAELDQVLGELGVDQPAVLVIDDFHHVRDEGSARHLLTTLRRQPLLQVVVCTRRRHPLEALAAGSVEVTIVTAHDLLLSVEDVTALAVEHGVRLSGSAAERLQAATGGWPAAVRQVLDVTEPDAPVLPLLKAEEYLRETVLPAAGDPQAVGVLARLALAGRLTLRLIHDLADPSEAEALVTLVEDTGLVDRCYRAGDVELVLPELVRTVLRTATAVDDPVAAEAMHLRLGLWFLNNTGEDHALHAFEHAAAAHDWETLQRVWVRHSAELSLSHPRALSNVLQHVPAAILDARPSMRLASTLSDLAARVLEAEPDAGVAHLRTYVELSSRLSRTQLDALPLHDQLYAGTGSLMSLRMSGRFDEADRFAHDLAARAEALSADGDDPGDRLAWFHLQRGITSLLRARPSDACRAFELSWQLAAGAAGYVRAYTAANLALTHALWGERPAASHWLARHHAFATDGSWAHPVVGAPGHLAAGLLALDELDEQRCRAELARLDSGDALPELWPFLEYLHAEFHAHFGDPAAALDRLEGALRSHPDATDTGEAAAVLTARAQLTLLTCGRRAQQATQVLERHCLPTHPSLAIPRARLTLLADAAPAARGIAAAALEEPFVGDRDRQELLLLKAVAGHLMGDLDESARHAQRAVRLYASTGLLRPFATLDRTQREDVLRNAGADLGDDALQRLETYPTPYPGRVHLVRLTKREQELAAQLARTGSRQEIAERLFVSINTVRKQLVGLYRKLDVGTREEALMRLEQLSLSDKGPIR